MASPLDQGDGSISTAPQVEALARAKTAQDAALVPVEMPPTEMAPAADRRLLRRRWLIPAALVSVTAHAAAIYALVSWLDLRSVEAETDEVSIEIVIEPPETAGATAEQADSDGVQPEADTPAGFAPPDPFVSQLTQPPAFAPLAEPVIATPDLPETLAGPPPMPAAKTFELPAPGAIAVLAAPPRFEPVGVVVAPEARPEAKPPTPQAGQAAPKQAVKPEPERKPRSAAREPERKQQKRQADAPSKEASNKETTKKPARDERRARAADTKRDAARSSANTAAGNAGKGAGAKDRKQGETGKTASSASGGAAQYGALVNRHVQRFRRYPAEAERAGIKGAVRVSIRIDSSGRLSSASVRQGSGHAVLDSEALATVRRASPYPKPPEGVAPASFSLTLRFSR